MCISRWEEKGIPIGNYTSQYYANIYLNELDYYIKYNLKLRYYVRYMDDFIILIPTKEDAKRIKKLIEEFLITNLKLCLNSKSRYFPNKKGIDFCGYKIYETHILLRKRFKKNLKKSVKLWNRYYSKGIVIRNVCASWASWLGHAKHANSFNLMNKYKNMINDRKIYGIDD